MLIAFEPDEHVFNTLFAQQLGGMPKYRGSPMAGGGFWGRVLGFARGLFTKAAPHITNFISEAQPHVKRAASKAVESAIDSAVQHVTEKIKNAQTGNGIKGRRRIKKATIAKTKAKRTTKKKRLREPKLKGSLL